MMLRIFRDKLIELVRGEEGVAFVVTLGVFFFMYLVIAGVYAVGTSVRERIHLQNACDAAAYSAAVVQADTLSRIATINRAMSWTYVQMTRRQMDYIVYRWLRETVSRYKMDMATARGSGNGGLHNHLYWDIGPDTSVLTLRKGVWHVVPTNSDKVRLNDSQNVGILSIDTANGDFIASKPFGSSFYARGLGADGLSRLRGQIREDKHTILNMNQAERDLADKMGSRIEDSVEGCLKANLNSVTSKWKPYLKKPDPCLRFFDDESRFLKWADADEYSGGASHVFKTGHSTWFPLTADGSGFQRQYSQKVSLKAAWHWRTGFWTCPEEAPCFWTFSGSGSNVVRGQDVYEERYFVGEKAEPRLLKKEYFGKDGAITVGIACKNENPWRSFIKTISGGLYSAFDPYCQKTVVFASAKAGYRTYDEAKKGPGRNYKIDWSQEGAWNLYTSDWDAVLMPVRMAKTMAESGNWGNADRGFLAQWVSDLGVSDKEMYSGGGHPPDMTIVNELDDDSSVSQTHKKWRWYNASRNRDYNSRLVQAQWQIEKHGASPSWNRLTDRMFH